jgi:predicted nuclease of predicted toxin-antitoxin system
MKLLLDQGLPRSTVRHLAGMGIVAEHVGDLGMARAADAHILDAARARQAVVVTLDADFHAPLANIARDQPIGCANPNPGIEGRGDGGTGRAGVGSGQCRA